MKFLITSVGYNVFGDELNQTLCEYKGEKNWAQPSFQRCWNEILFDSEYDALCTLRKLYPDGLLTVFEDTGKIISTYAHESSMTSMIIKQVRD